MLRFLLIILLLFAFNVKATDTVRIYNVSTLTSLTAHTNNTFSLVAEAPAGDGTAESTPAKLYVPMKKTVSGALETTQFFYLNSGTGGSTSYNLFGYTASGASLNTYLSYYIDFPLVLTINSTSKYLYAAVKSASSYIVAKKSALIDPTTNGLYDFYVSPQSLCTAAISATISCLGLDESGTSPAEGQKALTVYFFVSSESLTEGSADIGAPGASYAGGVYYQVNLSNQVYTVSELTVSLTGLRKGDGRVVGDFTTSSTLSSAKGTYVFLHRDNADFCPSSSDGDHTPGKCQGSFTSDSVTTSQAGEFTLANLKNGTPVLISVALIDKFGFATEMSSSMAQTPTQIEELLKKQACFLLTAGFGEEHYIITYFRSFRDQVLLKNWLGKKFVSIYYETAPKYALIIYKSELLRSGIRAIAYIFYFIFKNIKLLSMSLSLILLILIGKWAKKWQHQRKISQF